MRACLVERRAASEHAQVSSAVSTSAVIAVPAARSATRAGLLETLAAYGLTLVVFPLSWLLRSSLGLDQSELIVGLAMFQAAHVVNDPHFSVTYLLFYRNARARLSGAIGGTAQRVRYALVALLVPALLVGWAVLALML